MSKQNIFIDDIIDSFGCNNFTIKLILIIGILWMSEAVETNLISLIGPQLKCVWNLSSLEVSLTSSTVFLGVGIGSVYWGYFADKNGRKSTMIIGAFMTIYFGLLSAASPTFIWFLITRFFVGVGLGPVPSGACYIAELISRKHRGKAVLSVDFFYAGGSVFVALIALVLIQQTSWRVFLVVSASPSIIFLILSPWLPESIRFLQNTGKYDAVMKILHRISLSSSIPILSNKTVGYQDENKQGKVSILLSNDYPKRLIIVSILFIASFWGYFGLALLNTEILQSGGIRELNSPQNMTGCHELTTGDYIQNIVVVTAEIPGLLLPILLVDLIGRKGFTFCVSVLSGIGFLCLNFCPSKTYSTVLIFGMRFIIVGFAQMPYLFASELFPTVVRTTALGISIGVSKTTLIAVPYFVQYLVHHSLVATTLVFSGLCFLSSILVLALPETKNIMLDTI